MDLLISKAVDAFHAWADAVGLRWASDRDGAIVLHTFPGTLGAKGGDWIVKGPARIPGNFFVRSAESFAQDYRPAPAPPERPDLEGYVMAAKSAPTDSEWQRARQIVTADCPTALPTQAAALVRVIAEALAEATRRRDILWGAALISRTNVDTIQAVTEELLRRREPPPPEATGGR